MVRVMARRTMSHRILTCDKLEIVTFSGDPASINISDTIFGFLDNESLESIRLDFCDDNENNDDEDEEKDESDNVEDNQFWETQHQLLQGILYRTTSLESQIRSITKEAIKEGNEIICSCRRTLDDGCKTCLMKEVCSRLQIAGFNSAICKSKWKNSLDIPSGEHTFIDVIDLSNPKKGEVRVIIELNFRAEFEMARGCEEYNRLVKNLPEVFIGKIERLLSLIKILCAAAKKCMKDKKMHIGPWRKQKYMQAKWLKTRERVEAAKLTYSSSMDEYSSRPPPRPRASMLTVDLLENLPNLHLITAVEVL
ncbi:uncharacterized protein LOC107012739 [Solanum pennellii]|uniref:Uncharacterized protein LOC107012739 n=1 Tax=Solanum pennellii TaxID=28526 RepID=A0ABM1GA95_SOLPN|nr:uncharacterized protein LOC107012739 [Solanum pennellii]